MYIAYLVFMLLVSGCATMTDGTTQQVSFQTAPENVSVTLIPKPPAPEQKNELRAQGGVVETRRDVVIEPPRLLGQTPLQVTLDRREGQSIVFSKEGYKPLTMQLTTRTNPALWGNLAFGGLIGSVIDQNSGAALEYNPNQYFVTLIPLHATTIDQDVNQAQRDKAIVFIVRRYAGIMADVSRGSGEDWSALIGILRISPGQDAEVRTKIKAFATIYSDAATFATKVADFYYPR